MNTLEKEFVPYEQALELEELEFDEPCLAHLIGFGDGTKENGRYKINQQQVFYPGDYASSDDKAEELGLHPFVMCGVPLYRQAFRWFREKQELDGIVYKSSEGTYYSWITKVGSNIHNHYEFYNKDLIYYNTYPEAELSCLKKLIEIVKQKNESKK